MRTPIAVGETHTMTYVVPDNRCVPDVFPESPEFQTVPRVFATAYMVGAAEWACMEALRPHLEDGETSVGVHVDLSHTAATLPGMTVRYECTVSQVEGRTIWWDVQAFDDLGPIGSGRHARAVLDQERFLAGVDKRGDQAGVSRVPR